jgi:hypothetical protein
MSRQQPPLGPRVGGAPGAAGGLKQAINTAVGYDRKLSLGTISIQMDWGASDD